MVRDMTVKPAPPPVHVDEAETIRQLVDGPGHPTCVGDVPGGGVCGHVAVWGHDCRGCGHFMQVCEGHRDWADRRVENGVRFVCARCRARTPLPIPWVAL
jgi:hypothetical protein